MHDFTWLLAFFKVLILICYTINVQFNSLIPELYVSDLNKSLDFYTKILNFAVEYRRSEPLFAFLSYQGSQIMIQQQVEDEKWYNGKPEYPYGRGINLQIETNNIQQIVNSLAENNYLIADKIEDNWYKEGNILHGFREVLVMDPDGYLLRLSQGLGDKSVG